MKKIFTLIAAAFLSLGAQAELVKKADTSTCINTIQNVSSKENVAIYTLSGQRVSTPAKGINIIGGKKIVIK